MTATSLWYTRGRRCHSRHSSSVTLFPNQGKRRSVKVFAPSTAAGEVLLDVLAHARHDGHDRDQEHDADHHAEQGEEALELLHADLLEREPDGFVEGHTSPEGWRSGLRIGRREVSGYCNGHGSTEYW